MTDPELSEKVARGLGRRQLFCGRCGYEITIGNDGHLNTDFNEWWHDACPRPVIEGEKDGD